MANNVEATKGREALLAYFDMLWKYVEGGYIEAIPARHEVYVTDAAFGTLAQVELWTLASEGMRDWQRIKRFASHMRDWCVWLNAEREGFKLYEAKVGEQDGALSGEATVEEIARHIGPIVSAVRREVYAVHVVGGEAPHPLLFTILMTPHRRWWWPFKKVTKFDIISY